MLDFFAKKVGLYISLLKEVQIENGIAVIFAINLFKDSSLDFVDCLLISYNNVLGQHIISFDKKLVSRLL